MKMALSRGKMLVELSILKCDNNDINNGASTAAAAAGPAAPAAATSDRSITFSPHPGR